MMSENLNQEDELTSEDPEEEQSGAGDMLNVEETPNSNKQKLPRYLHHFTSIPSLLTILATNKLILTSSKNWEDKNDEYFLGKIYKTLIGKKTILSLSLTKKENAYLFWKIYGKAEDGACIKFNAMKLKKELEKKGFKLKPVTYIKFSTIKLLNEKNDKYSGKKDDPPIYKRVVYRAEGEWRIIYESDNNEEKKDLEIDLGMISEIKLNPWLKENEVKLITKAIKKMTDETITEITPSGTLYHHEWCEAVKEYFLPLCRNKKQEI